VLWRWWLGGRKGIRSVKKLSGGGAGIVICLERGAYKGKGRLNGCTILYIYVIIIYLYSMDVYFWNCLNHSWVVLILIIINTHTHPFNALCPGLLGGAGTRKVKLIRILLKQETVSGSGISWAICNSAPHSRQITMPATNHSVFYRPDALTATQPTVSKHWRNSGIPI